MAKIGNLKETAFDLSEYLNTKFKKAAIKIVHPHADDSPTKVKRWIPTGCDILDVAISNLPDRGGYPSGRLTVLYGPEQSGKSLAAMTALATTQKLGGFAVYIDTENALHEGFAEAIGINFDERFVHIPVQDLNIIFNVILSTIQKIRENYEDIPLTIVVDSIAGATTEKDEASSDFNSKGYNTEKARMLSDTLGQVIRVIAQEDVCLIFTNQARVKFNAGGYQNPWKMPHGQSIPHYSSVTLFLMKGNKIKMEMVKSWKRVVGREVRVKIEKNRLGPPETQVEFDVFYDRGIDNYGSWKVYAELFKLVTKSGAWYSYEYVDEKTGEVKTFKEHGWDSFVKNVLVPNPDVANKLISDIKKKYIICYAKRSDEAEQLDREHDD